MDDLDDPREHRSLMVANMVIVFGTVAVTILAVMSIVIFRPGINNDAIITNIIGFAGMAIGVMMTYMKSHATEKSMNSKMDEFLKWKTEAAHAAGVIAGQAMTPTPTLPVVIIQSPTAEKVGGVELGR